MYVGVPYYRMALALVHALVAIVSRRYVGKYVGTYVDSARNSPNHIVYTGGY